MTPNPRILLAAAALALAGCAQGGVVGFEREVTGGGRGLPETVARASQDVVTPPGRRWLGLAVRTWERDAAGNIVEVPATCTLRSGALGAEMTTPGRLVLPDLGPDAEPVAATCSRGALRGAGSVAPAFRWGEEGPTAAQRVAWGAGWWEGGTRTGPLAYPDLDVGLR